MRSHGKNFSAGVGEDRFNLRSRFYEVLGGLLHRVSDDQNILSFEFSERVGVARYIPRRLHTIIEFKDRRSRFVQIAPNLFGPPHVESSFAMFRFARFDLAICIFSREESALR